MQGKEEDDDLVDFNDDPEYAGVSDSGQRASRTPPHTPDSLVSDDHEDEEDNEDEDDLEEGQETEMDTQSTNQALIE